ncbi:LacI family DNA-binding transcriptional regulator [Actinophytocola algeriensis]|uniref:DNA-binding LacI/PurR family transcriptional regulator n=1 Tax=Actinophytocola algeriensis TaxID=1768010 RepID=A0A7W7VDT2_9PSEU|nr:LacI family DNA-binding transcriptional regulator [Actinophytocola algeriensis]MBB4906477.1 DNA-binding LacI/PurR family transcriptional regulator [Actinophytocola algeriensis]MBE1477958.1 DNA-binding LacI/PurR family transcriptional regulator [Actinophytocola algeriensis]
MARPTMEDVAARAGVSRALVSLVMRGSPKVSAARRTAVLEAAAELGYSPHAMARSLASRTSHVLGVMVSDLHNPFWAEVVDGLDGHARAAGFELVINTGGRSPSREQQALRSLTSFRPAGIALLGPVVASSAITAAADVPLVLVSRSSRLSIVDTVNDDGRAGSALAVDHLVALGHREIVHIDGGSGSQAAPRRAGYQVAMARHGLTPRVARGEYTEAAGAAAVRSLRSPFTAVLAANDLNAVGVLSALAEAGLRVPEDVSVVGYDNTWLAGLRHIGLTTIDQPREEMGRLAATALISRVRGERTAAARLVVQPTLVVRATTGPPRTQ